MPKINKFRMSVKYYFLFFLLIPFSLKAIHDPVTIGAASTGMGTIGVVGTNFHSLHNNQAALAFLKQSGVAIDYNQGFISDQNLSIKSIGFALPTDWGTMGINLKYQGFQLYNEQKIGLAYGKSLGKRLAVGVQLDYLRTFIGNDYGTAQALSFEIGVYSKLSENLELGAHIFNPVGASIGRDYKEPIPMAFKLGLLYHIDKNLRIATEVEKVLEQKINLKFGLEYEIGSYFISRIGLATQPTLFTFGFGVHYKRLLFDIGTAYHQTLGFTPSLSLLFNFN